MIYLDNGATSFVKPRCVTDAVIKAMRTCANPGRGGYSAAMVAADTVFRCRERLGDFFHCDAENVVFTSNCTHGLNIAIRSLVKPRSKVAVSGFEHNAVMRPLYALNADIQVCGRKLFDKEDTLKAFEDAFKHGVDAAVFTHVSNVFGYILPVDRIAELCHRYNVPFIVDAAQSAGTLHIDFKKLGAHFIAMPGHKGLLGPQGIGILLCKEADVSPLMYGGTGMASKDHNMPAELPERLEAGTLNVPAIAGLDAGVSYIQQLGIDTIAKAEHEQLCLCAEEVKNLGLKVFSGMPQSGVFSFVTERDCEEIAYVLGKQGIAVRAGLHCAPLAHESAGTLHSGTIRVSYGYNASQMQTKCFLQKLSKVVN